jgi:hypothetical protein
VRIEVVEEAQSQFAYRESSWRANRDAGELFEEEYARALGHLSTSPKSGDQYRIVRGKLIRRWLMKAIVRGRTSDLARLDAVERRVGGIETASRRRRKK